MTFKCSFCGSSPAVDMWPFGCGCGRLYRSPNDWDEPIQINSEHRNLLQFMRPSNEVFTKTSNCGDKLHELLKGKGYEIDPDEVTGCNCQNLITLMNAFGPQWVINNRDTVIIPSMVKEARRRKIRVAIPGTGKTFSPTDRCLKTTARWWIRQVLKECAS